MDGRCEPGVAPAEALLLVHHHKLPGSTSVMLPVRQNVRGNSIILVCVFKEYNCACHNCTLFNYFRNITSIQGKTLMCSIVSVTVLLLSM